MIRGLVIGKFMPVHNGHIALIRFAAEQCDELIVSMSFKADDPIPAAIRYEWLRSIFGGHPWIVVKTIPDDFDREDLPWPERTLIWAEVIRQVYPPFDALFSSEEYGYHFARSLGVRNHQFDPNRIKFPVSASNIRAKPMRYWDFIPAVVRPFFVRKVCFYGPESTGKTVMAHAMALKYKTDFVPEVAREFLITNDFSADDIIRIGIAHSKRIEDKLTTANRILFVDTDAITTEIYSQYYLGEIPEILQRIEGQVRYDHYFLFNIDVPWVADGLRDLGHKRDLMFSIFKSNLEQRFIPYTLVKGTWKERERTIDQVVEDLLRN